MQHGPTLLDDAAVEQRYGIKRGTLRAWRSRGQGPPYVKLSVRMARYRVGDLEQWFAERVVNHRPQESGR